MARAYDVERVNHECYQHAYHDNFERSRSLGKEVFDVKSCSYEATSKGRHWVGRVANACLAIKTCMFTTTGW